VKGEGGIQCCVDRWIRTLSGTAGGVLDCGNGNGSAASYICWGDAWNIQRLVDFIITITEVSRD
jgi:hypothetical protein